MPLAIDLLNPSAEAESKRHKLKRLVQSPNSYFMDVKCPGCFSISTVFSHAQTVVICNSCSSVLCQPTGGRARLTEGTHCSLLHAHLMFRSLCIRELIPSEELSVPCIFRTCCLRYLAFWILFILSVR
ncbi:ribosomal protein S27-domain-containing protein [Lactarius vividus]|nr:ribosomal protein S27-domain-containing protein [Lactarius vividus]